MTQEHRPDYASILHDIKEVRKAGVVGLRGLPLTELPQIAAVVYPALAAPDLLPEAIDRLLRRAVSRINSTTLRTSAELSLGMAVGSHDWAAAERRKRAAEVYRVTVERFRKAQEQMVLNEVAEQVLRLAVESPEADRPPDGAAAAGGGEQLPLVPATRRLTVIAQGRQGTVVLHVHPADLLRDVDVVVSPVNTYLALPEAYKSSVPASLRRAGSLRDAAGGLVNDRVDEELRAWAARHGPPGRPVLPGTVAATGSGALGTQGIRRIYHAAIAVPRSGTNDYDVAPADVTRCASRAFTLLAQERDAFDPPLRSICFPLLGAGRGGLAPEQSIRALWTAVEAELARDTGCEVHFVMRRPERAGLLEHMVTGSMPEPGEGRR
jgi:O-acetyl-ADP-ribose deacetylase (regulator of RNase III)